MKTNKPVYWWQVRNFTASEFPKEVQNLLESVEDAKKRMVFDTLPSTKYLNGRDVNKRK